MRTLRRLKIKIASRLSCRSTLAGQLFLNIGGNEKQALELATIRQRVAAVLRRSPGKPVLVWGDQAVPYGRVVTVMSTLQEAGAPSVGLVTESGPQG